MSVTSHKWALEVMALNRRYHAREISKAEWLAELDSLEADWSAARREERDSE
mgnify:CR=1 FL=1